MITRVFAKAYHEMRNLAEMQLAYLDKNCVISIIEPGVSVIFSEDTPSRITLSFHDIDPKAFGSPADYADYLPLSESDAVKIIEFIKRNHAHHGKQVLYVNCMAGISRSGAVARFVLDALGLDRRQFLKDNPQIMPNGHVLHLLKRYWRD
jgi:predicted protein tyrosine phosphatase